MSTSLRIGWIGLGNMGTPMSTQLIKAGYPLTVYNRNKDKEKALIALGASTAHSPAALLEAVDLVFLMVSNDQAIHDLFQGEQGLLAAKATGRTIINMSTVSPEISRQMAGLSRARGNAYLDAPVSGSVKQAETAQLVVMAGGEPEDFEKARPVLEKLGKLVSLVGASGAGNTAKLAMNILLGIHAQALAETVVFAGEHGIGPEHLFELINNSAMANVFARIKGDAILADNYKPAFALELIAKDLRLAKEEGFHTPLAMAAFQTYQEAEPKYGKEDIIAVLKQVK